MTPEDFIAESGFDFIKQNISSINIDFTPYLKLHKISITELNDIFINRYGKNINELIYFYRMEFAKYAVFKVGNYSLLKGIIINAVLNLPKNFTVNLKSMRI